MQIVSFTVENNIEIPQKIKTEWPYDPAILPLAIYSQEPKTGHQRYISHPFYHSISQNIRYGKNLSTNQQMNG